MLLYLDQCGTGLVPLLQFVVGVADFQQGIGDFGTVRIGAEQALEWTGFN